MPELLIGLITLALVVATLLLSYDNRVHKSHLEVSDLLPTTMTVASALASGVAGNLAYEALKSAFRGRTSLRSRRDLARLAIMQQCASSGRDQPRSHDLLLVSDKVKDKYHEFHFRSVAPQLYAHVVLPNLKLSKLDGHQVVVSIFWPPDDVEGDREPLERLKT